MLFLSLTTIQDTLTLRFYQVHPLQPHCQRWRKVSQLMAFPRNWKTDNGSPFQSLDFAKFADEKGCVHQRVTPLWPVANGEAENFMTNLKKIATTSHIEGKDWRREIYTFLSNYRATPHPSTRKSPYELFMNRNVQTKVPQLTEV